MLLRGINLLEISKNNIPNAYIINLAFYLLKKNLLC